MEDKKRFLEFNEAILHKNFYKVDGKVSQVIGLTIHVKGIQTFVGEVCQIHLNDNSKVMAEVVGFKDDVALLMPFGELGGIGPSCRVTPTGSTMKIDVGDNLIGKVLDGLGRPIDEEKIFLDSQVPIYNKPPNPLTRKPITEVTTTGIRAIDSLLTCGVGQRIGIFAGSGVGKSTLLGNITKNSDADVIVIGLIGERNRELHNFVYNDLGEEGMKKAVVVCATSDQPALVRLKGAYTATAIAEYYRDKGLNVMFMMDSVTRFAMAQREIGLAIGEPPTTKGYTPSVFALLPKLLERSGNSQSGSITAFYTVLVEGDDHNEPIADAVRGILDGHIILTRELAAKNHFPAIDINASISRLMPQIVESEHYEIASVIRDMMATYAKSEDLINVGAYVVGTNEKLDIAIKNYDKIVSFLKQGMDEKTDTALLLEQMRELIN